MDEERRRDYPNLLDRLSKVEEHQQTILINQAIMIQKLDTVVEVQGKVKQTLFGNGSTGMTLRLDRIEQMVGAVKFMLLAFVGVLGKMIADVWRHGF